MGSLAGLRYADRAGVPAGAALDIAGMQADPRTLARDTVAQAPHTRADPVKTLGHPGENYAGSAHVGGHTVEALAQHGYFEAEIEQFVAEGPLVAEKP